MNINRMTDIEISWDNDYNEVIKSIAVEDNSDYGLEQKIGRQSDEHYKNDR